jgi:hypothetical protein
MVVELWGCNPVGVGLGYRGHQGYLVYRVVRSFRVYQRRQLGQEYNNLRMIQPVFSLQFGFLGEVL